MLSITTINFVLLSVLFSFGFGQDTSYPLWKVFCSGIPLYRGRVDSIVTPGATARHIHKVMGGNHFSAGIKDQSPLDLYEVTRSASCTTCSIHTVDNSNYWHPDLYYRWPNGTLSLVPDGGLTVYYFARTGNGDIPKNTKDYWQPFPKGLRMVAGDPFRRTFDESIVDHHAISFVCLTDTGMPSAPETNGFQTDKYFCKNGLRLQAFFPMCWDGKNLDSPNHRSHMAYPTQYNGGDCPSTHPVRLPAVFYEAFYAVDQFPHGQGVQPFVLANGDPTGYGFHGDFVNGWDVDVVNAALNNATCNAKNTNEGNNPERCLPLQPFVKTVIDDDCKLYKRIPLTENIGMVEPIDRLPGCNPITSSNAFPCSEGFEPKTMNNEGTFHIQSKLTGLYLTFDPKTDIVYANGSTIDPDYRLVWGQGWAPKDLGRTVRNSEINRHFTMQDVLRLKGNDADTWEIFSFEQQSNTNYIAIKNLRYGQYLQVEQDFTISGQAKSITDACLFQLITPDGGYVPEGLKPIHSNELSKTEWQHIFYCLSEFPSKIKLIIDEKLPYLTFIQLKTRNITTEQLYSWSTPIDLIEDYQIYLNTNVTSLSNKRFYNCTLPKFGLHCQYELIHFSWQYSSLYDLVKGFYSLADDVSLISTCYMHLQCEHDVMSLCLQWTDICDGFINCLDGIDEKDCWQLEINQCHEDEHRCQMGQCIPKSFAIDQSLISDCIDTISNNAHRQSTHPCTSVYESVLTCNDNFDTQKSWSSMYASSQSRKLLNNMHLNDCWLAFACRMNSSCANLCQVHCPDFIFYYNSPIVFRNIYLAYHKNDSYTWANVSLAHIYICYNSKYYDVFFINYRIKISFNNFTCIHFPEILPNGTYFSSKTRLDLHLFIRTTLYNRLYKYHQIYDYATEVCNGASIYHCRNSTKCISIYRLLDSVYDCPYLDDEDYPSTAMNFINKTYFKCQNSSKYIHPKLVRNNFCDCNENQFSLNCEDENFDILHVQNTILFQHICDGYIDLLTNENNTDETECQHWPCNNIYTRCNDEWNCPTNEDEAGCYVSSTSNCSLNDLSCVSYDTSQSICLSNDKINNGHIDCLGGIDEPLCQRNVPLQINQNTNEDFRYFYCLNRTSHVCISQYDLCDGVNHCENDDDERVCINYRNIYLLYNRNKIKQIRFTLEIRRSTITNVIVHALSKQTTAPYSHIGRYHCGFGLPIRIVSSSHMLTCLCPPNYYGHLCQYQNQRISLALQFQALSDSARILFAVVVQLIDNTTEKIVHSVEQLSFLSITDCQKKFNIYLLYSTRPKQSDREYAIHIDFYEKQSLIYRGSVLYPIQFPFLPVHRLAYLVQIPSANDKDKLCFNFECQHGRCIRYWNNSQRYTFCQCEQGWSGKYCQISEHFCQCSSDSICLGKSSNNRSICICSMNKFGSRCYLNNHRQSTYLCSNGFHGDRCEIPDQQLNISFENNLIQSETYVFIHFHEILMEGSSIVEISRSTTFRTISMNTQSILIQWTQKFHLVFLELSKKTYYLVYAQNTTAATTQMKINSSDRCLHINELFNRTILQWDLIRRIKYYHLPCQNQSLNLKCFHDEIHFCLCYDFYGKRLANCLQFYQNLNPNCFGRSECENHGQCLQDHPTCPTRSMCLCKACSYGRRCQFHTNGSGLSLDPILGYYILPTKTLSHQPIIIKISLLLTIIFMLTGLVNGSCSLITFKNKPVQEVGCGLYLLGSSITTIILMILLVAKFIILLLTQMTILTNMSFLQIQCYSLDFLIRICLSLDQWFNACVASERALTTIQGAKFNKKKSVIMSKRIICFLIISVVLTSIHDPISRHVIIEDNENEDQYQIKRIWCIVRYGSTLEVYNSFIHTVHFFGPFLFNFISSIILIVKKSRQQQTLHPDQSYKTILRKQFQEHKHILIAPLVLVILALPRLILTYIRTCMQSESDAWLYLCGYFISFVPPMLTFVIFILPSKFYKKQFRQTIKQYRKGIRRRLHLDT